MQPSAAIEAEEENRDEVAITILNAINDLDSEKCISDPQKREEIISILKQNLNTVLRAVPEFETMAIIILSISIISVIALTNKSKLSLASLSK